MGKNWHSCRDSVGSDSGILVAYGPVAAGLFDLTGMFVGYNEFE